LTDTKLNALLRHHGVDPSLSPPLFDRVQQLASEPATRSDAIRVYRAETEAGLAEAEAHVATGSCLVKHEAKHEDYHGDQQLTNADLGFGG
jgi:hypothetical protein